MKKLTVCFITICIAFLVCGCDITRSYESVLNQIKSPWQKDTEEEIPKYEEIQQNPDQPKDVETQQNPDQLAGDTMYPIGVPKLEFLEKISENRESQNIFRAQYLVTSEQLVSWEKELESAGFSSNGKFLSDGIWNVGVTKLAQSDKSKADFRIVLLVEKASGQDAQKGGE